MSRNRVDDGDEFDPPGEYEPEDVEEELEDESAPLMVACPKCGEEIPEAADWCPYCKNWITQGGEGGRGRQPAWVRGVAAVLLVGFFGWLAWMMFRR